MNLSTSDTALTQQPSQLLHRLLSQLHSPRQLSAENQSSSVNSSHNVQRRSAVRSSIRSSVLKAFPAEVPNMGALINLKIETRMQKALLDCYVNCDSLIYPFEVLVTLEMPKPNDFMWDFKHNFYLSIMYSQMCRFFFPFSLHNSQLFLIVNESHPDDPLVCMNIPSRVMFQTFCSEVGFPLENISVAAISAYKDYMAFFRLSSKPQVCPDAYKNFCYVPPVWINKLD